jgi:hypothetical protein
MQTCRNCGASNLRDLGFIGALAPFFLKRVFRSELVTRPSALSWKRAVQRATRLAHTVVSRLHPQAVAVELQLCLNCSFIQTKHPFADDAIARLYADYRSESYNRERCHYEPAYSAIAETIGGYTEAGMDRVPALTRWLQSHVDIGNGSMLDFGGDDGRFLPAFPGPKHVFEISDVPPTKGVTRISRDSDLKTYSYVQLAHVLEHVTEPLSLVRRVAALVEENGYLCIEVPQDLPDEIIDRLRSGGTVNSLGIHEHINYYSVLAVQKLLEASRLKIIAVEAIPIVSPMAKQSFIRGLARR